MVESEDLYCEEQRINHMDLKLSMVFIRESAHFAKEDLAVFPPINHENLYIDESPSVISSPSSSSSLSDSSSSSLFPSDSDRQVEYDRKSQCQKSETDGKSSPSSSHLSFKSSPYRWSSLCYSLLEIDITQCSWKLLLARVLSNFQKSATFYRDNLCSFLRTLRSFYPVMGITIWWWMRNRARRRLREGVITAHLRDTIKARDERIIQLLHQITQMNELLVKKKHST